MMSAGRLKDCSFLVLQARVVLEVVLEVVLGVLFEKG